MGNWLVIYMLVSTSAFAALRPRAIFPKPISTTVSPDVSATRQMVLKMHEGTHVRILNQRLTFDPTLLTSEDLLRLARVDLTQQQVTSDVSAINALLDANPDLVVSRYFSGISESYLADSKAQGQDLTGEELADLELYVAVTQPLADPSRASSLINALNQRASVEISYPQPLPFSAGVDLTPTTPDFSGAPSFATGQTYLTAASSGGVDALAAWQYPGGDGAGVKIVDIETGWNLDHEDFSTAPLFKWDGINLVWKEHGTAVMGILVAENNLFGVRGMVTGASFGYSSPIMTGLPNPIFNVSEAILKAGIGLGRGDVVLIEQQVVSIWHSCALVNKCSQVTGCYLPAEYYQGDFDAIKQLTALGVVVVEAAGNGGDDLDSANHEGRFDRVMRDSGAIMVGASTGGSAFAPACFTNFGSRMDVHAWGGGVVTTGYGPTRAGALLVPGAPVDDVRQYYTSSFAGTSSASAIVAGATASASGIRNASGLPKRSIRDVLVETGTPQASSSKSIGPQPNLAAAANVLATALRCKPGDYDGDGKADLAIWRASEGRFYLKDIDNVSYGISGDIPVVSDIDLNGKCDLAVWRPSEGRWYAKDILVEQYGVLGDVPAAGDFAYTPATELAVWRPSTGEWWVKDVGVVSWGLPADKVVVGDYNGDGKADRAVWRPSTGWWYVKDIQNVQWGLSGDIPVPGDYNGDGTTDFAVWRPSEGKWYIRNIAVVQWGQAGDIPVPADYDGNGTTDLAVWRPSTGTWWIKDQMVVNWGDASQGDVPVLGRQ